MADDIIPKHFRTTRLFFISDFDSICISMKLFSLHIRSFDANGRIICRFISILLNETKLNLKIASQLYTVQRNPSIWYQLQQAYEVYHTSLYGSTSTQLRSYYPHTIYYHRISIYCVCSWSY